jgi:4-hydroxythreonine-4-phosphate dehydrogenase
MRPPLIAVTMGDPAGVGPEICLRILHHPEVTKNCTPIIYGDTEVLRRCATTLHLPPPAQTLSHKAFLANPAPSAPCVVQIGTFPAADLQPGIISAATGAAAFEYVNTALTDALAGKVHAITTAPLSKEALHAAGHRFPGHTEIFASRCKAPSACMMQYSGEVRASFVTVHIGLAQVPQALSTPRILEVIRLTADAMAKIRTKNPLLGVLGLNPHAGENGLFGNREEEEIIIPAIRAAQAEGIRIEGPIPPDTAFLPDRRRATDAFVCMYHDQGHIPLKALAFDSAVNTTLGLPIIRTSVDHGTACDIAWQGKANPGSLIQALLMAAKLTHTPR